MNTSPEYIIGQPVSLLLRNGDKVDGVVRQPLKRSIKILSEQGDVKFVRYSEIESCHCPPLLDSSNGPNVDVFKIRNDQVLWPAALLELNVRFKGLESMTDEVLIQVASFLSTGDMARLACASPRIARKKRKRRNKSGERTTVVAVILDEAAKMQVEGHARTREAGKDLWEWLWDCANQKWGWMHVLHRLEYSDAGRFPWWHGRRVKLSFFSGMYVSYAPTWLTVDNRRDNALVTGSKFAEAACFEFLQVGEVKRDGLALAAENADEIDTTDLPCKIPLYAIRSCRGESIEGWLTEGAPFHHRRLRVYYYLREQSFKCATRYAFVPIKHPGMQQGQDRVFLDDTSGKQTFRMLIMKEGRFHESTSSVSYGQISRHSAKAAMPNHCRVQVLS